MGAGGCVLEGLKRGQWQEGALKSTPGQIGKGLHPAHGTQSRAPRGFRGPAHKVLGSRLPGSLHCRGPAPAGSRGTLRMNGVGERETCRTGLDGAKSASEIERERERERERETERETRPGMCSRVWQLLYFPPSPLYDELVHF